MIAFSERSSAVRAEEEATREALEASAARSLAAIREDVEWATAAATESQEDHVDLRTELDSLSQKVTCFRAVCHYA